MTTTTGCIAFLAGGHRRCGVSSVLFSLSPYILKMILTSIDMDLIVVKEDDYSIVVRTRRGLISILFVHPAEYAPLPGDEHCTTVYPLHSSSIVPLIAPIFRGISVRYPQLVEWSFDNVKFGEWFREYIEMIDPHVDSTSNPSAHDRDSLPYFRRSMSIMMRSSDHHPVHGKLGLCNVLYTIHVCRGESSIHDDLIDKTGALKAPRIPDHRNIGLGYRRICFTSDYGSMLSRASFSGTFTLNSDISCANSLSDVLRFDYHLKDFIRGLNLIPRHVALPYLELLEYKQI